jgi:hypothetical protein
MNTSQSDKEREVANLLAEIEESAVYSIAGTKSAKEKLHKLISAIEEANADRFLSDVELHELVEVAFAERWPVVQNHINNITRMLSRIISQGNIDGDFNVDDCELAALVVRNACLRFWHPRLLIEFANETKPTARLMIDVCLTAFSKGLIAQGRGNEHDNILKRLPPYLN